MLNWSLSSIPVLSPLSHQRTQESTAGLLAMKFISLILLLQIQGLTWMQSLFPLWITLPCWVGGRALGEGEWEAGAWGQSLMALLQPHLCSHAPDPEFGVRWAPSWLCWHESNLSWRGLGTIETLFFNSHVGKRPVSQIERVWCSKEREKDILCE